MKTTAPDPGGPPVDIDSIDVRDPWLYGRGDPHALWQTLRERRPVHWQADPGLWVLTRYEDVRTVLRDHASFTSQRGILLSTLGEADPAAGAMIALTDPPRHQPLREPVARPLARGEVRRYEPWVRELVRQVIAPAWECDVWDAAAGFARLPVASVCVLLGLADEDVEPMLRWAYAAVAPGDPHYQSGSPEQTVARAHHEIMSRIQQRVRECRRRPAGDLVSHLIGSGRLTDEQIIVNCFNLFLGGAVTTSQAVLAAMTAVAEQFDGRWPAQAPAASAAEEALRWSSPTMQFVRHATRDVQLSGVTIRAGDAICACIASANRDGAVFTDPQRFWPWRSPNPHLAFGGGVHYCVGQSLARLTLQVVIEEFLSKLEYFEFVDQPVHLVSNLAAGIVSAPVRLKPAAGSRPEPMSRRPWARLQSR